MRPDHSYIIETSAKCKKNIFLKPSEPEHEKHRLSRAFDDVAWTCSRVEPQKERETLSFVKCLTRLEPAIQSRTNPLSAVNFIKKRKKTADLYQAQLELAIWSRYTSQQMPCFDRCQVTITLMSIIKDVCCKLAIASLDELNLSP